jgi:hypothetical protein
LIRVSRKVAKDKREGPAPMKISFPFLQVLAHFSGSKLMLALQNLVIFMAKGRGIKMQEVAFRNVGEFLDFLPAEELKIVERLRGLVFECLPGVSENLSYNVPFYRHHRNICFIWPASVLWGHRKSYDGVRLGFTRGYLMGDDAKYLQKGNRKQVYWKDFRDITEIDVEILRSYIFEAILIDEQLTAKSNGIQRKTR